VIDPAQWRAFKGWRRYANWKMRSKVIWRMKRLRPKTIHRRFLWWKWETKASKDAARAWADRVAERVAMAKKWQIPLTTEACLDWLASKKEKESVPASGTPPPRNHPTYYYPISYDEIAKAVTSTILPSIQSQ